MENIIEILKRWNPWEKEIDTGINRPFYIRKIYPYLERKEIIVLKGIRRSGKSTIAKQLMAELMGSGISRKQILYLNLEDFRFADNLTIGLFEEVLKAYLDYSENKKKTYFFIDEIQKIPRWEQWIRTKYDLNDDIRFIISGSSASLLSKELSTLLTGRNISFTIFPLSFKEFRAFRKEGSLEEYMTFGGFPEVVLEDSEERKMTLLQQYFEDIVHKDIIDRYNIRNTKVIHDLARYLVSASGSKLSINKLSKVFGIAKDTLSAYINYMIDAFLLFEVTYFSFSAKIRHDISKLPKLYSIDNGLINAVSTKYSKNIGQMFENTVFIKVVEQNKEISYWGESESEVDFIVDNKAINVTAADKIPEREAKGLEDFSKQFRKFSKMIVCRSFKSQDSIPIIEFLES